MKPTTFNHLTPFLLGTALLLTGCNSETTESKNVKTAGIWAKMEAKADGQRTRINVELNVGGNSGTNLVLSKDEYLQVSGFGESLKLREDTDFLDVDYQGYLGNSAGAANINITFFREDGETISNSNVTLPPSFQFIEPQENSTVSASDTLSIVWDANPGAGRIDLQASYTCSTKMGGSQTGYLVNTTSIDDDGMYDLVFADLEGFSSDAANFDSNKPCTINLNLERSKRGVVDNAYVSGSYFTARQVRSVEFKLQL